MTTPPVQLETWMTALERYARALTEYVAIIDDVAQKSRPAARAAYRRALDDASFLSTPDSVAVPAGGGVTLAEQAFALFARLEGTREALDAGASAAAEASLLEEATRRMSRTFVEGIDKKTRALRETRAAAAAAALSGGASLSRGWAPGVAAGSPADVARAYAAGPKSAAGAALFAGALVEWERAGKSVQAFAEGAKDEALGIPPDSPDAVAADAAARAGMHPLQAMGVTFGLVAAGEEKARARSVGGAVTIDATLPQARTAVRYNMAPLVDVRTAAAFGPLANIYTGLNYRLVDRLRTITEEAIPARDRPAASIVVSAGEGVVRTIDGGATTQEMRGPLPDGAYATVGAGPRPRVAQLGVLLEEAVYSDGVPAAGGTPRTIKDPERLLEDYDARADSVAPHISLDELGQTLLQRFSALYAAAPPKTADEFKAAVLGESLSRDPYRSYIAQAISEVSKRGAEARLLRAEASGGGVALLFGGRGPAAKGGRQEALLTSLVQLRQSVSAATGQLVRTYDRLGVDARVRGIYAPGDGDFASDKKESKTAQVARESRQRMEALAIHRAVVEEAFYSSRKPRAGKAAQVVEKLGTVEPRPSLKLYVLERGDTSAGPV
jgi:hypothetical protein